MNLKPPSPLKVALIITRYSFLRFVNALNVKTKPKKGKTSGKRAGTPRKSKVLSFSTVLFTLMTLLYAGVLSYIFLTKVQVAAETHLVEKSGKIPVSINVHLSLNWFENDINKSNPELSGAERQKARRERCERESQNLRSTVRSEMGRDEFESKVTERYDFIVENYVQHGVQAFAEVEGTSINVSGLYKSKTPVVMSIMFKILGLLIVVVFSASLFSLLGIFGRDLSGENWTMEHLFGFPVSAKGLFASRIIEGAFTNFFGWVWQLPFYSVLFWLFVSPVLALPLALVVTICSNTFAACIAVVTETYLRRNMSVSTIKNMQAVFNILTIGFFYFTFYFMMATPIPRWFVGIADMIGYASIVIPPAVTPLVWSNGLYILPIMLYILGATVLITKVAMRIANAMVRNGLISTSLSTSAKRDHTTKPVRASFFTGIVKKELLLLLRDRSLFAQSIIVPILIFGFNLLLNKGMLAAAANNFKAACVTAFGVGVYASLFGPIRLVGSEKNAFWMLYSFPESVANTLFKKSLVWCTICAAITASALAFFSNYVHNIDVEHIGYSVLSIIGVLLICLIASGLAVISTDPFEQDENKQIRPQRMFLVMILAVLYGASFYADMPWVSFVIVVLLLALTLGFWQRAGAEVPYMLDPTYEPPPNIYLTDGLLAAFWFFAVQALTAVILTYAGQPVSVVYAISYFVGGAVSVMLMTGALLKRKVKNLAFELGLSFRKFHLGNFVLDLIRAEFLGLTCAILGVLYLIGIQQVEFIKDMLNTYKTQMGTFKDNFSTILLITVIMAPVFEEFIFRGLLFKSMLKTLGKSKAIFGSALLFALVHPMLSFLPVLLLGILAAYMYDRTKHLYAPIVVHATYNLVVVWVS